MTTYSTSTISLSATSAVANNRVVEREGEECEQQTGRRRCGSSSSNSWGSNSEENQLTTFFNASQLFTQSFSSFLRRRTLKPIRGAHQRHLCVMLADDDDDDGSNCCWCQRVLIANCFLRNTFERRLEVTAKTEGSSLSCHSLWHMLSMGAWLKRGNPFPTPPTTLRGSWPELFIFR